MGYRITWFEEPVKGKDDISAGFSYCCTAVDEKGLNGGIPNVRSALPSFQRRGITKRPLTEVMKKELVYQWSVELMQEMPTPSPNSDDKTWTAFSDSWTGELKKLCPTIEGKPIDGKVVELVQQLKTRRLNVEEPIEPVKPVEPIIKG